MEENFSSLGGFPFNSKITGLYIENQVKPSEATISGCLEKVHSIGLEKQILPL